MKTVSKKHSNIGRLCITSVLAVYMHVLKQAFQRIVLLLLQI